MRTNIPALGGIITTLSSLATPQLVIPGVTSGASTILPGELNNSTFSPRRPPSIPLAVRSPYLNVWLDGEPHSTRTGYLPGNWPRHWTGAIMGWDGMVRVDGRTYTWMGRNDEFVDGEGNAAAPPAAQIAFEYTATRSIFSIAAGGVQLRVTFLTPVTADDLTRQSLTFSYLEVEVASLDGENHDIQLYCDVTGEFASGNREEDILWASGKKDNLIYQTFERRVQRTLSETHEQPDWGSWYWTTELQDGLSWSVGTGAEATRSKFIAEGVLNNQEDYDFRAVSENW